MNQKLQNSIKLHHYLGVLLNLLKFLFDLHCIFFSNVEVCQSLLSIALSNTYKVEYDVCNCFDYHNHKINILMFIVYIIKQQQKKNGLI